MVCIKDVRNFIYKWNLSNPVDRWWRERHKVPFNSPDHRISNFIDQFIEFEEKRIYDGFFEEQLRKQDEDQTKVEEYIRGKGLVLKPSKISSKKADSQFENLDLKDFKF